MFYDYRVLGYTSTGILVTTGCGIVFLLPNEDTNQSSCPGVGG